MRRRPDFDRDFPVAYALLFGAVALGVHLGFFPIGDFGVETDFYGELAVAAQKLWQGHFSVANYPYKGPLTSFALVIVYPLARLAGGDWYLAGVLLNALCAGVGAWLLYRLVRRLFGRAQAVCVTLTASLVFEYFQQAHKGSSDMLFFTLLIAAVDQLVRERRSALRLIAAGGLGGLAMLTRYNGLILPVAALAVLLVVNPARLPWPGRLTAGGLVVGAFVLAVAPWYVTNYVQAGRPLATRHLQNIFVEEFSPDRPASPSPEPEPHTLAGIIARDPARFGRAYLANIPGHYRRDMQDMLGPLLAVLIALGLLRLPLARPSRLQTAFFVCHLAYFLAMCLVYHQPRFFLPLLPGYFVVGWSVLLGFGTDEPQGPSRPAVARARALARPLVSRRGGKALVAAMLVVMVSIQVRNIVAAERYYYQQRPLFVLKAAPTLRDVAARAGIHTVMARKPHLPFYAGLDQRPYPANPGTAADLLAFARATGADAILVTAIERHYCPGLPYLDRLDEAASAPLLYRNSLFTLYGTGRAAGGNDADMPDLVE